MSHLDLDQGHRQSHLFSVFTFSTAIYIKPLTLLHSEWPDLQRIAVSQFWPLFILIVIVMVNLCESRTNSLGSLDRSGRVLVGHERSRLSTTVLVMFQTIMVLR